MEALTDMVRVIEDWKAQALKLADRLVGLRNGAKQLILLAAAPFIVLAVLFVLFGICQVIWYAALAWG
jgi:hypothetical protein